MTHRDSLVLSISNLVEHTFSWDSWYFLIGSTAFCQANNSFGWLPCSSGSGIEPIITGTKLLVSALQYLPFASSE
jgi:hypothetical protein